MAATALLAIAVTAAGVVGLVALDLLIRRPKLGIWLVVAAIVLDMAFRTVGLGVRLGPVRLALLDVVFLLVAAAGAARHARLRSGSTSHVLLYLLCILAIFSLVRGVPDFGQAAAREFRNYLTVLGGALYFSSLLFDVRTRSTAGRAVLGGAVAVGALVVIRWAGRLAGVDVGPIDGEYSHAIRVLSGPETYFLGEAFLIAVPSMAGRELVRFQRPLVVVLLVFTVLLNRRTMWAALLAGLVVLAIRDRVWARRIQRILGLVFLVGAIAVAVLPDEAPNGDEEVAESATSTGTLEWRIEGWTGLLEGWTPLDVEGALGDPFGSGFERQTAGRTVTSNPHSFYVETLIRLGLVGLVALAMMYVITIRRLLRWKGHEEPALLSRQVVLGLFVAHVVWAFAWPAGPEQGAIIGLAISAATWPGSRAAHPAARVPVRPAHAAPRMQRAPS